MEVREHAATADDGTRIWWRDAGRGAPAVLLSDGVGCAGFIWERLLPALARERRVIHWNYRGHGRTPAPADPATCTLPGCVSDLLAVLDAAGEPDAVLAGHSMGVQVSLEAHRRAPERVAGLMLMLGSPAHPLQTFHGSDLLGRVFPALQELMLGFPAGARFLFERLLPTEPVLQAGLWLEVNRSLVRREDVQRYLADLSRVDPGCWARILGSAAGADSTAHLAQVAVPTLVVGGEKDTFTPVELSHRMHQAIRGSELLLLPGGSHMGLLEHPELVELRVRQFLAARLPVRPPARAAQAGP